MAPIFSYLLDADSSTAKRLHINAAFEIVQAVHSNEPGALIFIGLFKARHSAAGDWPCIDLLQALEVMLGNARVSAERPKLPVCEWRNHDIQYLTKIIWDNFTTTQAFLLVRYLQLHMEHLAEIISTIPHARWWDKGIRIGRGLVRFTTLFICHLYGRRVSTAFFGDTYEVFGFLAILCITTFLTESIANLLECRVVEFFHPTLRSARLAYDTALLRISTPEPHSTANAINVLKQIQADTTFYKLNTAIKEPGLYHELSGYMNMALATKKLRKKSSTLQDALQILARHFFTSEYHKLILVPGDFKCAAIIKHLPIVYKLEQAGVEVEIIMDGNVAN